MVNSLSLRRETKQGIKWLVLGVFCLFSQSLQFASASDGSIVRNGVYVNSPDQEHKNL
ncbi:secreted protein, partial [gut metagenome]